jgi:predicted transcriptional regulator
MATTTLGVKLDDPTRERLKAAAQSIDRTPHWLIKQAIFNYLEKLEGGATLSELSGLGNKDADEAGRTANGSTPIRRSSNSPKASCRNRSCAPPSPQPIVALSLR